MTMIPTRDQTPRLAGPARRPLHPAAAGAAHGLTPREVWRIILKRKWLISMTFLICATVTLVSTFLWWMFWPGYTATAALLVSPPPETMMRAMTLTYSKDIYDRFKMTQAALVQHQSVLNRAANDDRVKATNWYRKNRNHIIRELEDDVKVSLRPNSDIIQLSMTGRNRRELPEIVNAMADACVWFAKQNMRRQRQGQIDKLKDAIVDLDSNITRNRRDLASVRSSSAIAGVSDRRTTVAFQKQILTQQISDARITYSLAESAYNAFKEAVTAKALSQDPEILQAMEFDGMLRSLKNQKVELETSLFNAQNKYGPEHRQVKNIKTFLEALEGQINDRRQEVFQSTATSMAKQRERDFFMAQQQLTSLMDDLGRADESARLLERALGQIKAYEERIKSLEERRRAFNDRLTDLQVMERVKPGEERSQTGPISLGALAPEPREDDPTLPNWYVMIPLGAFIGLALGFGLAFLIELSDTSVKSPRDLFRRIDLPLLGVVPHSDDLDEDIEDFRRAVLTAPQSPAAEAFRHIRTNLLFSGPAQQQRSLLVTSPAPLDGRTTVVMNLAASMAKAGRRVLVVDANCRRPAVRQMFPQAPEAGLSSVLVGQAQWRDAVAETDVPNLSVMAAGPLPPNPAELLGSDTMRHLVSEMTAEYDQVIFDGAPIMVVADSCILSTQVDGVILVVRAGANSIGIVQQSAQRLAMIDARVLGVVLQGIRTHAGGYLRKDYETFYEYHQKALS